MSFGLIVFLGLAALFVAGCARFIAKFRRHRSEERDRRDMQRSAEHGERS